jgi:hypothetical protein
MEMIALGNHIRLAPPRLDHFPRRMRRDQTIAPVADQVSAPGLVQSCPHQKIAFRLKRLQKRPLKLAIAQALGDANLLAVERIEVCVILRLATSGGARRRPFLCFVYFEFAEEYRYEKPRGKLPMSN